MIGKYLVFQFHPQTLYWIPLFFKKFSIDSPAYFRYTITSPESGDNFAPLFAIFISYSFLFSSSIILVLLAWGPVIVGKKITFSSFLSFMGMSPRVPVPWGAGFSLSLLLTTCRKCLLISRSGVTTYLASFIKGHFGSYGDNQRWFFGSCDSLIEEITSQLFFSNIIISQQ